MSDKQIQESGDDSVNIQANSITVQMGLTYSDVKDIALDVYRENADKLSKVAQEIAMKRVEEITDEFLLTLKSRNPVGLNSAQDPDFQYALLTVQREYAKSGNKDLGDLLVDILVERTKVEQRGLLQIVLNESLGTAPKLTVSQLNALSIIFSMKYTRSLGMLSLERLTGYLSHRLAPFIDDLPDSQASYQHLEFTRCGSTSLGSHTIPNIFKQKYPGVFTKGFSWNEFHNKASQIKGSEKFLLPCLRDVSRFQFNAAYHDQLKSEALKLGISDADCAKLDSFWEQYLMSDEEIKADLFARNEKMARLFTVWDDTPMKHMTLTSVGIAIGHAFSRSKTGDSDNLAIWIN
jgi:hypothetical protein